MISSGFFFNFYFVYTLPKPDCSHKSCSGVMKKMPNRSTYVHFTDFTIPYVYRRIAKLSKT